MGQMSGVIDVRLEIWCVGGGLVIAAKSIRAEMTEKHNLSIILTLLQKN
jgi:hypothetical protein